MGQYLSLQKTLLGTFCQQNENDIENLLCLTCIKHTNDSASRKVTMTNKVVRDRSKRA